MSPVTFTWIPAGALFVALVFATVAFKIGRRRIPGPAVRQAAVAGLLAGVAVMCVAFFGESMRHFGGTHQVGQGNTGYRCAAWWAEAGSQHGELDADEGSSPRCRAAAVDAVPTIIWQSGAAGALGLAVAGAAVELRRRRSADQMVA